MNVARFTWKTYGLDIHHLKQLLPTQFLEYEEMMYISNDYELAVHKDNEPKKGGA